MLRNLCRRSRNRAMMLESPLTITWIYLFLKDDRRATCHELLNPALPIYAHRLRQSSSFIESNRLRKHHLFLLFLSDQLTYWSQMEDNWSILFPIIRAFKYANLLTVERYWTCITHLLKNSFHSEATVIPALKWMSVFQ